MPPHPVCGPGRYFRNSPRWTTCPVCCTVFQLGSELGEQQERRPVLAQDGRQLLEVTHLEGSHLVQDKYKGDLVLHGERARGDAHHHGNNGGYHRFRRIVVADCKKFRMLQINQIEIEVIPCQHIVYVLIGGQLRHIVAEGGHIGGLHLLAALHLEVRPAIMALISFSFRNS